MFYLNFFLAPFTMPNLIRATALGTLYVSEVHDVYQF